MPPLRLARELCAWMFKCSHDLPHDRAVRPADCPSQTAGITTIHQALTLSSDQDFLSLLGVTAIIRPRTVLSVPDQDVWRNLDGCLVAVSNGFKAHGKVGHKPAV